MGCEVDAYKPWFKLSKYPNYEVKFPLIYLSKPLLLIQIDFDNSQKNVYFDKSYS